MKKEYRSLKDFMYIERPADRRLGRTGGAMLTCEPSSYFDSNERVKKHNAMCVIAFNPDPDSAAGMKCVISSSLSYLVDKPAGETWVQVLMRAGIPKNMILKELENICHFIKEEWAEG